MPGRHRTPEQRAKAFWLKVETEPSSGCWLWLGTRDTCGYGMVSYRYPYRVTMHAHRMAWQLANFPLAEGKYILHKCKNRSCVNPSHLYQGTQKENTRDQIQDGTHHFSKWRYTGKGHRTRMPNRKDGV